MISCPLNRPLKPTTVPLIRVNYAYVLTLLQCLYLLQTSAGSVRHHVGTDSGRLHGSNSQTAWPAPRSTLRPNRYSLFWGCSVAGGTHCASNGWSSWLFVSLHAGIVTKVHLPLPSAEQNELLVNYSRPLISKIFCTLLISFCTVVFVFVCRAFIVWRSKRRPAS